MLKPLLIEPKNFIGTKVNKIKIDKIDEKKDLVKKFYDENHLNEKESNIVINNLLKELFYDEKNYIVSEKDGFNHQKGLIDLSIKDKNREIPKNEILIEIKKPNDHDMINRNDFYKKSFYQALYYYLSDKKENNNKSEIKYLIITDSIKWFFIKTTDLEDTIFDKQDANQKEIYFRLTNDNTDKCYEEIKKYIEKINVKITNDSSLFDYGKNAELPFTFFHLGDIINQNDNDKLELFIKCISDANLLNKVDILEKNTLNQKFYKELLYIIGLEEVKIKNKVTLAKLDNNFSLMALIKKAFEDKEILLEENELKEKSLELSLLWINRLLFIQLFSSVLEKYKVINEPILNIILNKNNSKYTAINNLFFNVLNLPKEDRPNSKIFKNIPYINSSLFQLEDIEKDVTIKELDDDCYATLYNDSNINSEYENKLNILEYFIHFLNSYNIAVDENFIDNSDKDLINASVLGKIFEKINGYKDGSFYTPSYITEFMANDSIKDIIISKFNDKNFTSQDIDSLKKEIYIEDKQKEAIEIFNTIKVCDPAVGSGHFLVSSLNSMLLYKCKLGLFEALKPNQLEIIDDSLIINNIDEYSIDEANKNNHIQKIYEEIYTSKKEIIKNSIFGVDLNPKSVKISRLRLWIELLKHTYFTPDSNYKNLELLPNIDINIKEGNSLISKYPLDYNFDNDLFDSDFFNNYKLQVNKYKDSRVKSEKKEILKEIKRIKKTISKDNSGSFEWRFEFPEILNEKGDFQGFDLVIGNPPYIRIQELKTNYKSAVQYYKDNYQGATGKYDIYVLFLEKAFSLISNLGKVKFILPHKFLVSDFGLGIRAFLKSDNAVEKIIHFGSEMIFDDATIYTCIISLNKKIKKELLFSYSKAKQNLNTLTYTTMKYGYLSNNIWNLVDSQKYQLIKKIKNQHYSFNEIFTSNQGIKTGDDKIFILEGQVVGDYFFGYSKKLNKEIRIEKSIVLPILKGESIKRYKNSNTRLFVIYPHKIDLDNKTIPFEEDELEDDYPLAYEYLLNFKEELINKKIRYKTNKIYWYTLHRARDLYNISKKKIILPEISFKSNMTLDESFFTHVGQYNLVKNQFVEEDEKLFLSILNSELMWYFIKNTSSEFRGGYFAYQSKYLEQFSFPKINDSKIKKQLINYVETLYALNSQIDRINIENKINQLVYKLYGLTESEINMIELNNA